MSIPKYIPLLRSKKINYRLLHSTRNRSYLNIRYFKTEYHKVQNVFFFWLLLTVFTQIGMISFLGMGHNHKYIGLKVNLPDAENSILKFRNEKELYIWIDRSSKILINDFSLNNSREFERIFKEYKSRSNGLARLYINRSCTMDYPNLVISKLKQAGFHKIYFMTKSPYFF